MMVKVSGLQRFARYSLGSLAAIVTILAVSLGYWSNRAHHQRAAVQLVRKSGAKVWYSDQVETKYDEQLDGYYYVASASKPEALAEDSWVRDYLYDVVAIDAEYVRAFSDYEMNSLADLPNVRFVGLSNTNITSRGVTNLRYCPDLLTVDLSETVVDDSCLGYLADLHQLHILRLIKTNITDEGLVKLWLATNLRSLDLNAPHVSEAAAEQIQRQLPECKVIFAKRKTVPTKPQQSLPGGGFALSNAIGTGIEPVLDRTLTTDELNLYFEQARLLIHKPSLADFYIDEITGESRGPNEARHELDMFNVDRRRAAERLLMVHHRCVIPVLAAILRDETDDPRVRAEAAESLAYIPEPLVVEILIEELPEGDGVGCAAEYSLIGMTMVGVGRQKGDDFNEQPPEARLQRQAEWRAWWDKNRDRVRLKPLFGMTEFYFTEAEWEAQLPKEQREIPQAEQTSDSLPETDG